MKTQKNLFFPLVLFFFVMLSASLIVIAPTASGVAYAASNTTPRYTVNYKYQVGSGSPNYATSHTFNTSIDGANQRTATVSIYFYGGATQGTSTFYDNGYINSNSINIISTYGANWRLKNSSGAIVNSGYGTTCSGTYNDGFYTYELSFYWSGNIHGYPVSSSWSCSFSFNIDTVPPSITISCGNGNITNNNVSVVYSDGSASYSVSKSAAFPSSTSIPFSNGYVFGDEGNYLISSVDSAGNKNTATFTIDKSAPTLSLSGVTDGGFTNGSVSASWGTIAGGATSQRINGNDTLTVRYSYSTGSSFPSSTTTVYTRGTQLTAPGNYFMTITDRAGNSNGYTFTIDTSAPTLSLSGVTNGGFTNGGVSASWTTAIAGVDYQRVNSNDTLTVKYSYSTGSSFPSSATTVYTSGTQLTAPGNYLMTITDRAGNSNSYTFTIDKSAPTLSLSGVTNGGFTNGSVSASWGTTAGGTNSQRSNANDALTVKYLYSTGSSFPSSATTVYTSGTQLTAPGNYLMTITDAAGNSNSYTFTIDTSAPTLSLSGVTDGGFTNGSVSASWTMATGSMTAPIVNAYDALTVKCSLNTDSDFPSRATTAYTSGTQLTAPGNYLMTITDAAGNSTSYTFTIDKSAPTLSLSGVTDGGFTNGSVSASWTTAIAGVDYQRVNSNDTLTVKHSYSSGSSFPSSATTVYTDGTQLTAPGNYLMTITDAAGNSSSYTFTIDKSAPTLSLSGVTNGGFTNGSVSASWGITAGGSNSQRINSNDTLTVKYSFSTDSSFPSRSTTTYSANAQLVSGGNYIMTITDAAGNSSSYNFTIDKSAPSLSLTTSDSSAFVENRTKANVAATWGTVAGGATSQRINANDTLTVKYSCNTNSDFPSSATTIYANNEVLSAEGKYLITITDRAGNSSSYTFEVYRQAPSFSVLSASGEELSTEVLAYNKDIKITFAADCTAKINNTDYSGGTLITTEGEFALVVTDKLGNKNSSTIYIIKTLPTANFDALKTPINRWYETTTISGTANAFALYDNAYAVADARERATLTSGTWTAATWDGGITIATEDLVIAAQGMSYYVYKSYNNSSVPNAYFSIATLNKSIEKYVANSILTKYPPATPALAASDEIVYRNVYFSKTAITFNTINNCKIFIDGIEQGYPYTLTAAGQHSVIESDVAGNSVSYSVIIDTAQPIVRTTNLNGNLPQPLSYNVSSYFTYGIRIYLDDMDEQAILKINEDYYLGGVVELRAAGTYTISTRDAAGNTGNLIICISLIEPTITITENEVSDVVNSFTVNINKNYNLNEIKNLSISKYDSEAGDWVLLSSDNSSSPVLINKNTLIYNFNVSGDYRIIILDTFGRFLETTYSFIKGSPKGTLSTTGGTLLTNGSSTKNNVYFTWSNLLDCSAEISTGGGSPVAYAKGTIISNEGTYTIKIYSNIDDVFNLYSFIIDKSAPIGNLIANGAELAEGATTRFPVSLNWTESGCTATLNGEPYASGNTVGEEGEYSLELKDEAGNKRTYSFRIKTTPPKATLTTSIGRLGNYDTTKYDVYVSWSERNCVCLLNGANYTSNTKINIEGSYTVLLTDAYGNSSSYFFSIDKTAPTGVLFVDGQETAAININTNKKVSLSWTELACDAVINDDYVYQKNSIIAEDGIYTIKLTDKAGNSNSYNFTIKTIKPVGRLLSNGEEVASDITTKYDARLTWTESGCTATVNGETYSKGVTITSEGTYVFVLYDAYGNLSSWKISIDKTAPIIDIRSGEASLANSNITRENVYLFWDDLAATATLNGIAIEYGAMVEDEGEFTLIVTDSVGNRSSQVFIIDKTAKEGSLIANSSIIQTGSITRYSVYFTWNSRSCTATVNGDAYSKGALITSEGAYTITLTDEAGNVSYYAFTIDKTAPTGVLYIKKDETLFPSQSGVKTFNNAVFAWTESGCTATVNGEAYVKDTELSKEGTYTFLVSDAAGNSSSYTITIDKTAPLGKLFAANNYSLESGNITKYSVFFTWAESGCIATVNGDAYSKGTLISSEGAYSVTLTDEAGNVSYYAFTIDKTAPTGVLYIKKDETLFPSQSGVKTNGEASFVWTESGCSATLNGNNYLSGSRIALEGYYTLSLTDTAGNISRYNFTIDTSAPAAQAYTSNNNIIQTGSITKNSIYFTWAESGCTATVNGKTYSKETLLSDTGIYYFVLTDTVGNSSYIQVEVYKIAPNAEITPINDFVLPYLNDGFSITWAEEGCTATLNGLAYDKETIITAEGEYIFILSNKVGVEAVYNIIIDRTAPTAKIYNADNLEIGSDVEVSLQYIYFDWEESNCTATVNGEEYRSKTYIIKDGYYTLALTDEAGNTASISITVARTKPSVTLVKEDGTELTNGSTTSSSVLLIANGEEYSYKLNGNSFDAETAITEIGTYTVEVTDKYGNSTEYTFTIKAASDESQSNNPFKGFLAGSDTGTIVFGCVISLILLLCIVFPFIKTKVFRKNPYKKKLK